MKDEGSIIKKMKFMTSKGGALLAAKGTMISTKELLWETSPWLRGMLGTFFL